MNYIWVLALQKSTELKLKERCLHNMLGEFVWYAKDVMLTQGIASHQGIAEKSRAKDVREERVTTSDYQ